MKKKMMLEQCMFFLLLIEFEQIHAADEMLRNILFFLLSFLFGNIEALKGSLNTGKGKLEKNSKASPRQF